MSSKLTLTNLRRFASGQNKNWKPSGDPTKSFYFRDLLKLPADNSQMQKKPTKDDPLGFGKWYADHMTEVDWNAATGWNRPQIKRLQPFELHPAAKVLHYALELFEGMKAYRGVDGKIRLFRPELNMARMRRTAKRAALPDFDSEELIKLIKEQVRMDADWVPSGDQASLYIRPALIGTDSTLGLTKPTAAKLFVISGPVGAYFGGALKPVSLLADPKFVRACEGGAGAFKMGSNYAPTIEIASMAEKENCQQVLWLFGEQQEITEAGAMNIFVFWKNEEGVDELLTPSLDRGLILPGVTRQSIIDIAKDIGDVKVTEGSLTMAQLERAVTEKRVYEMFGSGTAVVVTPVGEVVYKTSCGGTERLEIPTMSSKRGLMKSIYKSIVDIQYGRAEKEGWTRVVV